MNNLDKKINDLFAGTVVRKDLVKAVKGNAIVPSYVLEYLLGQYCATSDEASINAGIETVKDILSKHYVHRNEAGLVRSIIKEKVRHKVIDKISVSLNDKKDVYEATFANLGIDEVVVGSEIIKKHPKLLIGGVWCICDLEYFFSEEEEGVPWGMTSIKPIQLSHFDYDSYVETRRKFTTDEWIHLIIQSIGFNPELFGKRSKLLQLVRLIPFCERNYNVIELGPKGTGKSHVYSEFSPHGILISGGEITLAKLFVNNSTGKLGLVGYWDTVAFDEFAGKQKRVDKALVDVMKNYMANKTFSRGVETLGAEASMAFVGNTSKSVPHMLKNSDLFDDLPEKYHDSAFLDRLHCYIPGWELDIIRAEMFSDGYGFVVDYFAEVLRHLRNHDYSLKYKNFFSLGTDISTRDRDGIHKTFSGLMKILFPHNEATEDEVREILEFAIEGRKRVKDQLFRIDSTYAPVNFKFSSVKNNNEYFVQTLEEKEYPSFYFKNKAASDGTEGTSQGKSNLPDNQLKNASIVATSAKAGVLIEKQVVVSENQKGISFEDLLIPYLEGVRKITITDPYVRLFYQTRNLMELLEQLVKHKSEADEVEVVLVTIKDEHSSEQQINFFTQIRDNLAPAGLNFSWSFDMTEKIHARHIVADNGWKILLDRGLDIFQQYDMNDAFAVSNRNQKFRACKAFEVTYIKENK
ncbi:MAG: BREX system Lon protease-like protein BrxL [Moraxellaceae bacterium]|nr:BREX system Lon protease-like protein BrxL [Pseudobdellovibrionaceae bacterium]